MAFYFINDVDLEASLLRRWVVTFGNDLRFAELVVSYLIRHQYGTEVGDAWTQKTHSLLNQHE